MSTLNLVILIIGIMAVIEGGYFFLFQKGGKAMLRFFSKMSDKKLRKIGFLELLIGIILVVIASNIL